MPKNAIILMVRHAEKPLSGDGLSIQGQERAHAYSVYFQNYVFNGKVLKIDSLFASAGTGASHRPKLTIEHVSKATGLEINAKHKDKEFQKLADDLLHHPKYDNSNSLICWHHGEILNFAKALGADPTKLPVQSDWPDKWPESVFGWVLQLVFDAKGNIISDQTLCISEKLMYDDYGQLPPGKNLS